MTQEVLTQQANGVFTIQMNRPEKKNALTQNMYALMAQGLQTADKDDSVRVVMLCGTKNLFTAGNDIEDFQTQSSGGDDSWSLTIASFFEGLLSLRKPLIAAVQGHAIGIGTTMLLHCDLVYAGKSTIFSMPFVDLGLCPEFGSSFILPNLAGHQRASELFLLGEKFGPEEAREVGIVSRVFNDDILMDEVMKIAERLTHKSPAALMATKKLMKRYWTQKIREAINADGEMFASLLASPEAREAFDAFTNKRAPDFSKF